MKKLLILLVMLMNFGASSLAAPAPPIMSHSEQGVDITISWTAVPGATGYTLFYAPYPFQGVETIGSFDMGATMGASFHLWEGAQYFIAVQAYDGSGSSDYSNVDYFIMGPPTPTWVDDDGDGFHENSGDCDDTDPLVGPAQPDLCGDGIDQDCSGSDALCDGAPSDIDSDGYTSEQGDCDDGNPAIHPQAFDVCADNIDQDCSGEDRPCSAEEVDDDFDGFTELQGDCNDSNASFNPRASDICEDGIDQDCSGSDRICPENIDNDYDGFTENQGDCNDQNSTLRPGAADLCGDGIDQDCSGGDPTCTTTAEAPLIMPMGGEFTYGQVVTMTASTPGAQIRYTTNGTTPTLASPLYTSPIAVDSSATINALAYRSGMNPSPVAVGTFTINPSMTGNWLIIYTMGSNSCLQSVGSMLEMTAGITQSGSSVTITTEHGSGSGTLDGNQGSLTTTQPVTYSSVSGTLTLTMNFTVATGFRSFSGPATFRFSGSPLNCSGSGNVTATRVLP